MILNNILKTYKDVIILALAGFFAACSADNDTVVRDESLVEVILSNGSAFMPEQVQTRAGETPEPDPTATGYRYGNYIESDSYPAGTRIAVLFANDAKAITSSPYTLDDDEKYTGFFQYEGFAASPKWTSTVTVGPNTGYLVYGHVPYGCCGSSEYDYSSKTMTLKEITPISNTDVSVIVGVGKNHYWSDAEKSTPNTDGAFPCNFKYTTGTGKSLICLLMDHLFVQTRIKFAIEEKYYELRDIYIRKVTLSTEAIPANAVVHLSDQNSDKTKSTAVTGIDWSAPEGATSEEFSTVIYDTTDPDTPLDKPTGWTAAVTDANRAEFVGKLAFENTYGYKLTTDMQLIAPGFFSPTCKITESGTAVQSIQFKLKVEYDVYDKAASLPEPKNKIRSGQTSINGHISSNTSAGIASGQYYDVKISVKPTYLYQLSDGDLDNPSLSME